MRERFDKLIAGASQAGVARLISGVVGGVAVLVVLAVLVTAGWTAHLGGRQVTADRERAARAIAEMVAANTDMLLRQSDESGVRRQMIEIQATGLVLSCRVQLSGVGVIAASDPSQIGVMIIPESWSNTPIAVPESTTGTGRAVTAAFEVPGRGAGQVEVVIERAATAYGSVMAQAGVVALMGVVVLWIGFVKLRQRIVTLASVGSALAEVNAGERRASVLRLGECFGPVGEAWNALLDERDLQDRQIAEHALINAEMAAPGEIGGLVAVCDTLSHGLVIIGADRGVLYVNGAAGVLLGRHRQALAESHCDDAFEDEAVRSVIDECFQSRGPVRRVVEIARGEPGREPDAELRMTVRSSESGGEWFAGVLIEDITQQRVADRSRNSFVAQATHELRTPLTNIRLYIEQMVDEGDEDPQLRAQAMNVINSEARRLERIVSDMLSVAEIEAGSLSIRPGDVRTDALFEELSSDYSAQAADKTLALVFDLPPKLPAIRGDRDRLGQALHNLVGNALKYTPPGGTVTVRVETPEAGGLVVRVIDTGIGIDPEECERIFDRFYRANDRRIAHVTGSGLGLALAREIVRLHGGDITVESKLDQGSEFVLTLPASEETRTQRAA
jgi:signal transduction histidine kinase